MKTQFSNYTLLQKIKNGTKIEIIRENQADETSPEIGFRVSGVATTYNSRNENGGIFQPGDFDKQIRDYFKKNSLNMICPVEHDYDFDNRGVFEFVETTEESLTVTVVFYRDCCSKYEIIKAQVLRGILQGFSTYGWVFDSGEVVLENISLVANPSDTGAKLFKNTRFVGFEETEKYPLATGIENEMNNLLL